MKWRRVSSREAVDGLRHNVIFFKHSHSCGISVGVLREFEGHWAREGPLSAAPYLISVHTQREISNYLAEKYDVRHESPQLLLIQDGACALSASHRDIRYQDVQGKLSH